MKIIDVSLRISPDMLVFPGDPQPEMKRILRIEDGKPANVSEIKFGTHTGTHVDPPLHFLRDAAGIDSLDLGYFVGGATVVDLSHLKKEITAEDLKLVKTKDILLLKTRNSERWGETEFPRDFVYITKDAAEWMVENKIKTVGFDWLSIEKFGEAKAPAHNVLLKNRVAIIEGLNLKGVKQGDYFFACLPLKIANGDGAPARAVLVEFEEEMGSLKKLFKEKTANELLAEVRLMDRKREKKLEGIASK